MLKPHQPFLITIVDRDKSCAPSKAPPSTTRPGTRRKRKLAPQGARWMSSLIRVGTPSTARNLPHKAPLSTRRSAIRVSEISDVFRQARSSIRNPSDERAYCPHRRCPLALMIASNTAHKPHRDLQHKAWESSGPIISTSSSTSDRRMPSE